MNVATGIFLLAAAGSAGTSASAELPPGTYRLSCSDATVTADSLSANCRSLSGASRQTTLKGLDACLGQVAGGGDIGNIDGNLLCIADLPASVPGVRFPESETVINGWVYGGDVAAQYRHGWMIWAGLTQIAGAVNGTPVRAFQTWSTPSNMIYRIQSGLGAASPSAAGKAELQRAFKAQGELELSLPRQFRNLARQPLKAAAAAAGGADTRIAVSVAYNPPAATHAVANKLFLQSTLNRYLRQGYADIPDFPSNAITIKPVYKVITAANTKDGIYTFPGWPGTPSPAVAFPENDWKACVYVDVKGSGKSGNAIDKGCRGRTPANTFHLDDFVHQKLTDADAQYLNSQLGIRAAAGDTAILVGMHVTSRETKRWTWQTFWWSADADAPYLPSSAEIARERPQALDAAARHYAMSVAYQMVAPAQPINGGRSVGSAVIGYNPHLEAGFDPGVFQVEAKIAGPQGEIVNRYGVQTNCMSCHGLAQYDPTPGHYKDDDNREKPYAADFYFPQNDAMFAGKLKLDFAWSILGKLVLDDDKR